MGTMKLLVITQPKLNILFCKHMKSIEIGDLLFHNSDKPVSTFDCTRENFVCFGLNLESISQVGGSGYTSTFEVIDSLGT